MSGQFTIGHLDPSTGKANLVAVKCDLCTADPALFDPAKVEVAQNEILRIIQTHICKKVPKPTKPKKKRFVWRPRFMENVAGSRRARIGRYEEEDDAPV